MASESLDFVEKNVEQKDKLAKYTELIDAWVKSTDLTSLKAFITHGFLKCPEEKK